MYRLENPDWLWALAALPVFAVLYLAYERWRKQKLRKAMDAHLVEHLIPLMPKHKLMTKFLLFSAAFFFLVIGLANPQIGSKLEEVKREGIDLIIAIDLSNSMLAEDLSPNRLDRAKMAVIQLMDQLHSDRIGLVVFGGTAYTQIPLTTDYSAAKMMLKTLSTDDIPTQGTAIGAAINQAVKGFDSQSKAGKAVVVITDGENHEDDAESAARAAAEQDIKVFTVGMGSVSGQPIPLYKNGRRLGYRKDREGNSIVTRLNEPMLQQIAAAGNGTYIHATNADAGLDRVFEELNSLETAEYGTKSFTDYEDRFQYFVATGLLLLLIEFFVSDKRNQWLKDLKLFEAKSKL
ncbi:VWA domain-containing protein [bacterium SCSIO 12741]|nr:VWA domain-containing protein [bacterium SCSIO 12741]